jgi:hypothetical protein
LQVRHLRNGVSQTDTSHMMKPTTAVMTAPVPASCVRVALPKNTAAKTKTHPLPVMVPPAADNAIGNQTSPWLSEARGRPVIDRPATAESQGQPGACRPEACCCLRRGTAAGPAVMEP